MASPPRQCSSGRRVGRLVVCPTCLSRLVTETQRRRRDASLSCHGGLLAFNRTDWRAPMRRTLSFRTSLALPLLAATMLVAPAPALAKTEIHFWHAMTGQLGDAVNELVKQFNDSQTEYEVKPLRKGTYPETLTA